MGAVVVDADRIVHDLLTQDQTLKRRIVKLFGPCVLKPGGALDRTKIRRMILNRPRWYRQYNAMIHPLVTKEIKRSMEKKRIGVMVFEIPLLYEVGLDQSVDTAIVVVSSQREQMRRARRKGWNKQELKFFMGRQKPLEEKIERADFVIRNNTTRSKLKSEVRKIWKKLQLEKTAQKTGR